MKESEVFRGMFRCPPDSSGPEGFSDERPITLPGVPAVEFETLLDFFYTECAVAGCFEHSELADDELGNSSATMLGCTSGSTSSPYPRASTSRDFAIALLKRLNTGGRQAP
jgi:hypothetical protein